METRYTHGHVGAVVANHATRTAADSASFLLPHLRPDMLLLDVGCGPGSISLDLATRVANVVGVDTATEAIDAAQREMRRRALGNVDFRVADAYALPFDDATFDAAYAHQLLQHLGDPVAALTEMSRVLRPGGLVAVRDADYGTMVHSPHDPRLDRWLELYHELTRHHGAEADAGRRLLGWVNDAGYVDATATTTTWTYATPQAIASWRDLWVSRLTEGRMGADLLARGMIDGRERDDLVRAWEDWASAESPFFAFLHGEVVATKAD